MTRRIRTYAEVGDGGGGDILAQVGAQAARVTERLAAIDHVIAVASGKGGVGKSLVSANLAAALAARGRRVGVLDGDLNGPSTAAMLGAARTPLRVTETGVEPATSSSGCRVMSMDLLLATADAPVRWREPAVGGFVWQSTLETGALRELLADTAWGALDYLLIDLPPGTDKIARLLSLVARPAALLLVTTPATAATAVVARSVTLARDAGLADVALVSNMDGYACPRCGAETPLFPAGGGAALAARTGVPLWATIPFDPAFGRATDTGEPLVGVQPEQPAVRAVQALADAVERHVRARARPSKVTEAAP
jgi:ATP-binding protein involved in chromosome partitioning